MNKAQPLSSKNREQRHSRREQQDSSYQGTVRFGVSDVMALIESAAQREVQYAVRDYIDSKDFVTNKQLDERLSHTEKLFDAKLKTTEANLRQEMGDLGTALLQEMGKQSTELRQEMGKQSTELRQEMGQMGNKMLGGFAALAALITLLAFFKPEPQQVVRYEPAPTTQSALKAPAANP